MVRGLTCVRRKFNTSRDSSRPGDCLLEGGMLRSETVDDSKIYWKIGCGIRDGLRFKFGIIEIHLILAWGKFWSENYDELTAGNKFSLKALSQSIQSGQENRIRIISVY